MVPPPGQTPFCVATRVQFPACDCDLDSPVPDWVIDHPATLAIFQSLGIDYSCGGKSLAYACREQRLDPNEVLVRLQAVLITPVLITPDAQ